MQRCTRLLCGMRSACRASVRECYRACRCLRRALGILCCQAGYGRADWHIVFVGLLAERPLLPQARSRTVAPKRVSDGRRCLRAKRDAPRQRRFNREWISATASFPDAPSARERQDARRDGLLRYACVSYQNVAPGFRRFFAPVKRCRVHANSRPLSCLDEL